MTPSVTELIRGDSRDFPEVNYETAGMRASLRSVGGDSAKKANGGIGTPPFALG
jgi:hypothetical protein